MLVATHAQELHSLRQLFNLNMEQYGCGGPESMAVIGHRNETTIQMRSSIMAEYRKFYLRNGMTQSEVEHFMKKEPNEDECYRQARHLRTEGESAATTTRRHLRLQSLRLEQELCHRFGGSWIVSPSNVHNQRLFDDRRTVVSDSNNALLNQDIRKEYHELLYSYGWDTKSVDAYLDTDPSYADMLQMAQWMRVNPLGPNTTADKVWLPKDLYVSYGWDDSFVTAYLTEYQMSQMALRMSSI